MRVFIQKRLYARSQKEKNTVMITDDVSGTTVHYIMFWTLSILSQQTNTITFFFLFVILLYFHRI